jgi:hypothetical protein
MSDRLRRLIRETFVNPRGAMRAVLDVEVPRAALIEAAILVSALAVLASFVPTLIYPLPPGEPLADLLSSPLLLGVVQFILLILIAIAVFLVGRAFGGEGTFHQSIQAMVWLNFVVVAIEIVELPLYLIGPAIVAPVNLATMIFAAWLSVNTIAELHRFRSLLRVFAGMMGASFLLFFVILMIAGILLPEV